MRSKIKSILISAIIAAIGVISFTGCGAAGTDTAGDPKTEILKALSEGYPPDQKEGSKTSDYEMFKFEPLTKKPEGAEDAWCVNFLFTWKMDADSKLQRSIGFGNVIKKDGKYSYASSIGCELSEAEQKKIYDLKNSG